MSKEPIYPLERYEEVEDADEHGTCGRTVERSVNQRLAPIFQKLLDDPDGWEGQLTSYVDWRDAQPTNIIPITHGQCDQFRIVPKRRTPNETAGYWADWLLDAVAAATQDRRFLRGDDEYDDVAGEAILRNAKKAIHNAMEAYENERR